MSGLAMLVIYEDLATSEIIFGGFNGKKEFEFLQELESVVWFWKCREVNMDSLSFL